jgi:hypothetical protein
MHHAHPLYCKLSLLTYFVLDNTTVGALCNGIFCVLQSCKEIDLRKSSKLNGEVTGFGRCEERGTRNEGEGEG